MKYKKQPPIPRTRPQSQEEGIKQHDTVCGNSSNQTAPIPLDFWEPATLAIYNFR